MINLKAGLKGQRNFKETIAFENVLSPIPLKIRIRALTIVYIFWSVFYEQEQSSYKRDDWKNYIAH